MTDKPFSVEAPSPSALELITAEEACALIGGAAKPINPATLYRGVAAGTWPKPVRIGRNTSRWLKPEIIAAIRRRISERDGQAE